MPRTPESLRPFFCYFGGKYRLAPYYTPPKYQTIIEPFAGAAGYATTYAAHDVVLCDLSPIITGLWNYLIRVPSREIRALPLTVEHVDDLRIPQEAKWLIGFWLNKGSAAPRNQPSTFFKSGLRPNSYWGLVIRERIATQVEQIRHWRVIEGSFDDIPNQQATWFVDPPYQNMGRHYPYSFNEYTRLGEWCMTRHGQCIVCENKGADWLPFKSFKRIKSTNRKTVQGKVWESEEVVWES